MQLTLLGTGCPSVDYKRCGSANLVSTEDTRILIDCGSGVTQRLNQAKISLINIDQASYKNSLDELMILVAKSFPNHSTDVKNFMREIAALEGVDFDLLNININATLLELKKILDSNAEIINN